jgi:hypothetical protein
MENFTLTVVPRLLTLASDHSALRNAADELDELLRKIPSALVDPAVVIANTKGAAQDLIVSMGGTGISAGTVLQAFKMWLGRDRRRSLTLRRMLADGSVVETTVEGDDVSDETIRRAIESLDEA